MRLLYTKSFVFGAIFFSLSVPLFSQAAALYIDPAMPTLFRGDSVTLALRLDTDEEAGECVNAVDAVISYPANIEPVDISIGRSIFNIWVEQPTINKQERTISFAGGIPNGYCGRVSGDPMLTNVLAEIIFRSPGFSITAGDNNETIAKIEFTDSSTAYLNDGYGTKASLISYPSTITLEKTSGQLQSNDWQKQVDLDEVPPEDFSIQLQKGDGNFLDRYYIVFNTTDKQTGIDRYQIMEEPLSQFGSFQWGRADAPWVTERSPYVLKDQTLNSIIRVKAIDKAGNEYIANLIPDSSIRTLSSSEIKMYFLIGVSILVIVIVIIFLWWFIRKRKRFLPESEESQSEIDAIPLEEGAIKLNHENK